MSVAQCQVSANLLQPGRPAPATSIPGIRKEEGMVPLLESKTFLQLPSGDFCFNVIGWNLTTWPPHTKETEKYSFLTGKGYPEQN